MLSVNNNSFTHNVFSYLWIMQIHFSLSMDSATFKLSMNIELDSAYKHFTYPWIVNSSIHVQLDELV